MSSRTWKAVVVSGVTITLLALSQPGTAGAQAAPSAPDRTKPHPLTAAAAAGLAQGVSKRVIVVLRNQHPDMPAGVAGRTRARTLARDQAPITDELHRTGGRQITPYQTINAVAATVSPGEASRLAGDPAVAEVVADTVLTRTVPASLAKSVQTATTASVRAPVPAVAAAVCPAPTASPLLEPEALQVTHTASDNSSEQTARGLGFTGAGVKVAFMVAGVDTGNPDFIRADGSRVFVDYQDFSGDGLAAAAGGGDAFADASAIAAQGSQTYDVSHFSANPTAAPCTIRISGMAPGVQLVGLKVFASNNATTTSAFLQAIDYAVNVAHADLLDESLANSPHPDTGTQDVVRLFNQMAVAAGVTITTPAGDAGPTGTISSPATDPSVISVGASTTFRWYAQTSYGAAQLATNGWINDNISALSSGGMDQSGRTIDLVAPGDASFGVCTADVSRFADCTDLNNNPSPVERSSGTTESAALTAGAAALVIQAYRSAHHGSSPSPALVKQILTSTADDLFHPAEEQGAGRLNSLKAVEAARSVSSSPGSRVTGPVGSTLLTSTNQINAVDLPGTPESYPLQVTNTGAGPQTLHLQGRTLGAPNPQSVSTRTIILDDNTSQHFADWSGRASNSVTFTFPVAAGQDRLNASIAYQADPAGSGDGRVRLVLIDPNGRYAGHSLPQGIGNAGHVGVGAPVAGTWTAIIFSLTLANQGTVGPVLFGASTSNYQEFGYITPSTLTLAAGETATATVWIQMPVVAGDRTAAIGIDAPSGQTSIPITMRSLLDPAGHSGTFNGQLTGGNGRNFNSGQTNSYQFDVPPGHRDVEAAITLAQDASDPVYAYLVDPQGQVLGYSTNQQVTGFDPSTLLPITRFVSSVQLYHKDPAPGRWTLIFAFAGPVTGQELSQSFSGTVQFDLVDVTASGLPNDSSTVLPAGLPVKIGVTVHNTGIAPQAFFVDPRLDVRQNMLLSPFTPASGVTLPAAPTALTPSWLVPTETDLVAVEAVATVPVTFDYGVNGPDFGDPHLSATSIGTVAYGTFASATVTPGVWFANPAEIGPFGPGGAHPGRVDLAMVAHSNAFDPAVTAAAVVNGQKVLIPDLWQGAVGTNLLIVDPGHTATIEVTMTPSGPPGTVVSGRLLVDDLTFVNLAGSGIPSGDELAGIPYRYRVGP